MKWKVALLFVIVASVLFAAFNPSVQVRLGQLLSYSACDTPLPYKIGTVDPRFGFSQTDVQQAIDEATGIWESAEGKKLFTYSRDADLSVNFVYDKRQALNTQIQELDSNLAQKNATLQQEIDVYTTQVTAYEQKLAAFKALVNKYNKEGGAPPDIYNSLIQEQKDLQAQGETLNNRAKELNLSTHDYNSGVSNLNKDINQLNTVLAQKPEEGLYNGKDRTITIYLSNSHNELIHTLAHEFGHALGMAHVEGQASIMYPYTSDSLNVTSYDRDELNNACKPQSAIAHEAYVIDDWLITQMQHLRQYVVK